MRLGVNTAQHTNALLRRILVFFGSSNIGAAVMPWCLNHARISRRETRLKLGRRWANTAAGICATHSGVIGSRQPNDNMFLRCIWLRADRRSIRCS
jgi:hypothetical protein